MFMKLKKLSYEEKQEKIMELLDYDYLMQTEKDFIDDLSQNKEKYVKNFIAKIDLLFKEFLAKQEEGKKGAAEQVIVYFLRSSIVTETFDFCIHVYDQQFLWEAEETFVVWNEKVVEEYFKRTIQKIKQDIKGKLTGVVDYDYTSIELRIGELFLSSMYAIVCQACKEIFHLKSYQEMKKSDNIKIYFGEIYGTLLEVIH